MNKKSVHYCGIILVMVMVVSLGGYVGVYIQKTRSVKEDASPDFPMHRVLFMQKEFFEKGYTREFSSQSFNGIVRGGIVNHHLLSLRTIADVLHQFRTDKPVIVVLLSPDHFFAGRGLITTTLYDWKTPYGVLAADAETITSLTQANLVTIDPLPFDHEHGISGIVPLIKKEMPQARIIPIIFKDTVSIERAREFARTIAPLLPKDTIVIASLDFSHNAPSVVAQERDEVSKKVIQGFEYDHISEVSVDSRPALAVLMQIMDEYGARKFELFENTNSAKLIGKDIPDATSYITGVFVGSAPPLPSAGGLSL